MATRQISRTDLIGTQSLSFIRPQIITFTISKTKPLSRLYAYFDGVDVNSRITPTGGSIGGNIITDASGSVSGTFSVPANTFNTGTRELTFLDDPDINAAQIPGAIIGSATAKFTAAGLKQTFQNTITNITDVVITIENIVDSPTPATPTPATTPVDGSFLENGGAGSEVGDPLAQTFFTYGITGGCFITKIDIWFQSKDSSLPVTLEVRNVVNGYPGPLLVSKWASVVKAPADVNTSNNSSVATSFLFPRPIYLEENRDFCFVLMANSNKYFVWTSKFGDVSIETGNTIFEQPYIGSLFKSENNITWTAEQTEDIKFKIYKAVFDISTTREFTSKVNAPPILVYGSDFSVTSGSAVVSANFKFQHGHKTGDKIVLNGIPNATYRGIPVATLSNPTGFTVTSTGLYTLTFNCGANATSTGTLASSGILNAVDVDNGGSGYVNPTITLSGGGASTQATAVATVVGGKITAVTVLTQGVGYTSTPTLTLSDAAGVGAVLVPISETLFGTSINRRFQNMIPVMFTQTPPQTRITNTTRTSDENFVVGQHEIFDINTSKSVGKHAVLVNQQTEIASFGSNNSTQLITRLESVNANVSPVIDLAEPPRLLLQNFIINGTSNAASELTPSSGTAHAKYISKITTIETPSKGVRIFVSAASVKNTSFDVFFRTSLSSNASSHKNGSWISLTCDVEKNLSNSTSEYKDYLFYADSLSSFDAYDIKIVMYSTNQYEYPRIDNYRCVILAT